MCWVGAAQVWRHSRNLNAPRIKGLGKVKYLVWMSFGVSWA